MRFQPQPRLLGLSMRLCRAMKRIFPHDFRQEWGDEYLLAARDLLQGSWRKGGSWGLISALIPLLCDTLRRLPAEHWRSLGRKQQGPHPDRPPRRRSPLPSGGSMDTFWHDLRYSIRSLARNPGYALVAVLTLALAMGANTTVLSLVDAVLIRSLPFAEPDRLVALWVSNPERLGVKTRVSGFDYLHWKEQSQVFDKMALYSVSDIKLRPVEDPVLFAGSKVTEDFFPLLGVRPLAGRLFLPEDFEPSADPVLLLSYWTWQRRFGGDRSLLGRTVSLNDAPATVIGVLPPQIYPKSAQASGRLEFLHEEDFAWLPLTSEPNLRSHVYGVLARLRPEAGLKDAQAEMETVAKRLEQEFPASHAGKSILTVPLREEAVGAIERPLWILMGAVVFVLLIACVNVANLTLVRAEARRKELAVRSALGAGRARLMRQFATEGILLAMTGGVLGLLLAFAGVGLMPSLTPQGIPRLAEASVDARVLAATFAVCLLTGLIFGILPALQAGSHKLEAFLKEGGRTPSSSGRPRTRRVLVAVETALAVVLVIGAGLMIQSFQRLQAVDLGFIPSNALTLQLLHNPDQYSEMHQLNSFYDRFLSQIKALPGVEKAAATYDHPLTANWSQGFLIENDPPPKAGEVPVALFRTVTPGYFEALGIPLLQGRLFGEGDDATRPGVALVNQSLAGRFFAGRDPLGSHFRTNTTQWVWKEAIPNRFEIVGVVGDVKFSGPDQESEPAYYIPFRQTPQHWMTVVVVAREAPELLLPAIRQLLRAIDPEMPVLATSTLSRFLSNSVSGPRFSMLVLGAFAGAALLLSLIGLWGVLSDSVRQRTHEIGIRMALGAGRKRVFRLLVLEGLKPALLGSLVGIAAALALNRMLAGMLFKVSATDPVTYALVPAALLAAALAACALPARRASRTDPMRVLRCE
ncbi:MAG: ABC transporter permease [Acidobacteriota bacterium]